MIVVLMGVSGSGKTTIGTLLARRSGSVFADADDYHSAANKLKMALGHPLNDIDRLPWLTILNKLLIEWFRTGQNGILACSALKEAYRDRLSQGMPTGTLHFVLLEASRELIAERIAVRGHEFMNPNLLESQLETLEPPRDAFTITNNRSPEIVAGAIIAHIDLCSMLDR